MLDPLNSDSVSAEERIGDIAAILAAGLMRALARKSSVIGAEPGEVSLHFSLDQSGHARRRTRENDQ